MSECAGSAGHVGRPLCGSVSALVWVCVEDGRRELVLAEWATVMCGVVKDTRRYVGSLRVSYEVDFAVGAVVLDTVDCGSGSCVSVVGGVLVGGYCERERLVST